MMTGLAAAGGVHRGVTRHRAGIGGAGRWGPGVWRGSTRVAVRRVSDDQRRQLVGHVGGGGCGVGLLVLLAPRCIGHTLVRDGVAHLGSGAIVVRGAARLRVGGARVGGRLTARDQEQGERGRTGPEATGVLDDH